MAQEPPIYLVIGFSIYSVVWSKMFGNICFLFFGRPVSVKWVCPSLSLLFQNLKSNFYPPESKASRGVNPNLTQKSLPTCRLRQLGVCDSVTLWVYHSVTSKPQIISAAGRGIGQETFDWPIFGCCAGTYFLKMALTCSPSQRGYWNLAHNFPLYLIHSMLSFPNLFSTTLKS